MKKFSRKMENALAKLFYMIKMGMEFPDACWKVAEQYSLKVDELRRAYDIRCAED